MTYTFVALPIAVAVFAFAPLATQAPTSKLPAASVPPRIASPAEIRVNTARAALAKDPKRSDLWNELAMGLARRARETANPDFYDEALTAVAESLKVEPNNLEGRKAQIWILLGQHEFPKAAALAEALNKEIPDDVLTYGFLVDAYTELGKYDEAEKAGQWMLDMRPGNVPGLTRGAHLRELFGDHDGAVELMDTAYRRTQDAEVEDRAWILTHIAHLSLLSCRTQAANAMLDEALKLFPEYHYALAQLAHTRLLEGKLEEAAALRKRHYAAAAHPENLFELGMALKRAGQASEADKAFASFEKDALAESENWDNANQELIAYYLDVANKPAEAMVIAKREAGRRQDVRTLEGLAWAQHKTGASADALVTIEKALKVGIRQPVTFYRAGVIAAAAGKPELARKYLEQSVGLCGTSEVADEARAALAKLGSR